MLQIVCIDARLQLDGYIVSPSTCMKQGIGNDSSDRNFNFQQEVVIPTQLLVKETIGVGVNEKAVLLFYQTALSFTSISIFPW